MRKFRDVEILDLVACMHGGARYGAVVGEYRLLSFTLEGIKAQIGRVLNGLPPADCGNCRHMQQATPITVKRCMKFDREIEMGCNFECPHYQVRVIR